MLTCNATIQAKPQEPEVHAHTQPPNKDADSLQVHHNIYSVSN